MFKCLYNYWFEWNYNSATKFLSAWQCVCVRVCGIIMCAYCYTCLCGTVFVGLYMCVVLYTCVACVWYLSHCMYVCGVMYLCGMTCECGVFVWHYICVHGVVHVALQCMQCFCTTLCIHVTFCFCVALHVCVVLCMLCSIMCVWCYVSVWHYMWLCVWCYGLAGLKHDWA